MKDEQSDAHAYSIAFQILGAVVVAVFSVFRGFEMPPITQYPINYFLLAVLYGLGTLFLFKALKSLEASELTIITSVRSVVTIVSAVFLLGEVFDFNKTIGTTLILLSAYLVSKESIGVKFNKGVLYALGMALFYGLGITNDAFLLKQAEVFSYLVIGFLFPGLFLIAVKPTALLRLNQFLKPRVFLKMLLLVIVYAAAAACFYLALEQGANASQATPILQATVITTVILAAIFLKERDHLFKKFICAVLVTIGILLLT